MLVGGMPEACGLDADLRYSRIHRMTPIHLPACRRSRKLVDQTIKPALCTASDIRLVPLPELELDWFCSCMVSKYWSVRLLT